MSNDNRKRAVTSALALVAWGLSGCGSATPGDGGTPEATAPAASSTMERSPSASADETASGTTPGPDEVTISFDTAVPAKRWGDPPFAVSASRSDGGAVAYAANGGCSVASDGMVTVAAVGTCTITATALGVAPPAQAQLLFAVERAVPVITFGDRSTRFMRPFSFPLGATVAPSVELEYEVLKGHPSAVNDDACTILDGALTFDSTPTLSNHPPLSAACMVQVSAATASEHYVTPEPVQGLVEIGFPAWDVNVPPIDPVDWSESGGTVTIAVHENSGDAFAVEVFSVDGVEPTCTEVSSTPFDSPPGTTRYDVTLALGDPATAPTPDGYTCNMVASALPQDYSGGTGSDDFTVTVVP